MQPTWIKSFEANRGRFGFLRSKRGARESISLEPGSRVAIVGGGPAGSFFAYFLLTYAREVDLDLQVDIYEPRSFDRCGPAGCNHCGGIVSESLVQILATEGIRLPPEVVQRGIETYGIHMDVGSVSISNLHEESRIASLFRGNGPRGGSAAASESFDGYLLSLAVDNGARVVRRMVADVRMSDLRPQLWFADQSSERYDFVAISSGVNSRLLEVVQNLPDDFEPPDVSRTYICEFKGERAEISKILGNSVHVFLLDLPRLEFAAIIPKGEFATVAMVGDDLDQDMIHAFLRDPVVRAVLPTGSLPCVCACNPLINVGAHKRPYADRVVLIGDSGVTRLYKDGIGAAYRTAKAAAISSVLYGIGARDFQRRYWPACRTIARDNAIGKLLFASTTVLKRFRLLRRIIFRMLSAEQVTPGAKPYMSTLMWNMFTGSAPYGEMIREAARPGFVGNILRHSLASLLPSRMGAKP